MTERNSLTGALLSWNHFRNSHFQLLTRDDGTIKRHFFAALDDFCKGVLCMHHKLTVQKSYLYKRLKYVFYEKPL